VVPAKQTDQIYNKLQSNGINSEMHLFQNEGHGFKNEAIISECMKLEEKFYEKNLNIQRIH
jgi:dipeptidyl aminopeptidase/acylaminoacyl peptidase